MENNKKYLVLDFGMVLAYPATGHWFITPYVKHIANEYNIDLEKVSSAMASYSPILSRHVETLDEEEVMFYDYYLDALNKSGQHLDDEIIKKIAHDTTHNDDKWIFYDTLKDELNELSKKYNLIMLSDNWPCSLRFMKESGYEKYFDKIYISSVYGVCKTQKKLFDYPIEDFNMNTNDVIFVDDNEGILDIAKEKGFDVRLMNRDKKDIKSQYKVITNLLEI